MISKRRVGIVIGVMILAGTLTSLAACSSSQNSPMTTDAVMTRDAQVVTEVVLDALRVGTGPKGVDHITWCTERPMGSPRRVSIRREIRLAPGELDEAAIGSLPSTLGVTLKASTGQQRSPGASRHWVQRATFQLTWFDAQGAVHFEIIVRRDAGGTGQVMITSSCRAPERTGAGSKVASETLAMRAVRPIADLIGGNGLSVWHVIFTSVDGKDETTLHVVGGSEAAPGAPVARMLLDEPQRWTAWERIHGYHITPARNQPALPACTPGPVGTPTCRWVWNATVTWNGEVG